MLPLYAGLTGGFLAWYRARKLKKSVQGVPWAETAYGVLYDAEDDDDWEYNLQPEGIQQWALGYGLTPELYSANADTHAYAMAYNEGHRDARNQTGYKPDIDSRLDKVAFRDAYKLRAESKDVQPSNDELHNALVQHLEGGTPRSELEWYWYTKGGGSPHRYAAHCLLECGRKTRAPSKICSRCKKSSLKTLTLKKLQTMAKAFGLKKPSSKKVALQRIKGWLKQQPTIRPASEVMGILKTGKGVFEVTEDEIVISRSDTEYIYAFHRAYDKREDEYMAFTVIYHNDGTFSFSLTEMDQSLSTDLSVREVLTTDPYIVEHNNMEFIPRLPESDGTLDWDEQIVSYGPKSLHNDQDKYVAVPISENTKLMGIDIYLQNPITGDKLQFFTVYFKEILASGRGGYIDVSANIIGVDGSIYNLSPESPSVYWAETAVVSGKKKGKVISLIGSDPRLRKLKKDKDITPEEAATRLEISAEPNYNYSIGPWDGQVEQTPSGFGAEHIWEPDQNARMCPKCHEQSLYTVMRTFDVCANQPLCDYDENAYDSKYPEGFGAETEKKIKCEWFNCKELAVCELEDMASCKACAVAYLTRYEAETKLEVIQECLFCPESEGLVEIDIEGYPEYICEYCLDPTNWAEDESWEAENWGGDPDGILAKALAKARDKMKERKSLNITKLPDPNQKTLDEFNGAVVWKEPKGIVEKVMVREMAMQQLALSEAILELEQYIRLGMISEEEAFRKIVAMSQ